VQDKHTDPVELTKRVLDGKTPYAKLGHDLDFQIPTSADSLTQLEDKLRLLQADFTIFVSFIQFVLSILYSFAHYMKVLIVL